MYFRHEIAILCILVIVFQIEQCRSSESTKDTKVKTKSKNVDSDAFKNLPPPPEGYHYEFWSEVKKKHKPGSYKIVTLDEAKQITRKKKTIKKVQQVKNDESGNKELETNDRDTNDHDNDDGIPGNGNDDKNDDHDNDVNDVNDKGNDDENSEHGDAGDGGGHDEENIKEEKGNDDENSEHGDAGDGGGHDEENIKEEKGNDDENSEHGDAGDGGGHDKESIKEKGNDDEDHEKSDPADVLDGGVIEAMEENAKDGDHGEDHEESDPADVLDGGVIEAMEENAKDGDHGESKKRKKRDFFKLPFMSSGKDSTETVVTAKAVTTTSTNPATDSTDAATVTNTTVTATAVTTGDKSDSSGDASAEITQVTAVTTSSDDGFMGGIQSGMLRIVTIGKNMKASLIEAAPYLPMVWKVAVFIVPGLSQYEMLMLTVNVATITAEALHRYNSGESMSSIITDVAKNELWKSIISKRDNGFTIGDYASNIYDTVKTHFGYIPRYFSGDKSSSSVTVTLDETKTTINSEIPGTEVTVTENEEKQLESNKMTENLKKKIMDMKNNVHHSSEGSMSGSDGIDDDDYADDDIDDDSDVEINIKAANFEVDKTLFDQVLESSMKLQPDFVQKMSGGELVEYLNNMNIKSVVDSKPLFDDLTNKMGIDGRVTDEQKNKLVDVLSKITDYFIAKGLAAKQYMNSVID